MLGLARDYQGWTTGSCEYFSIVPNTNPKACRYSTSDKRGLIINLSLSLYPDGSLAGSARKQRPAGHKKFTPFCVTWD